MTKLELYLGIIIGAIFGTCAGIYLIAISGININLYVVVIFNMLIVSLFIAVLILFGFGRK